MALTTLEIKHAKIGMHADGGGLYLQVAKGRGRSWIFRYQVNGRRREMGLGSLADLSVTKARALAEEFRALTKKGRDPLQEKKTAEALATRIAAEESSKEVLAGKTFRAVATEYIGAHEAGWRNAKHAQQWTNTYGFVGAAGSTSPAKGLLTVGVGAWIGAGAPSGVVGAVCPGA